jgi:hypothetical protein
MIIAEPKTVIVEAEDPNDAVHKAVAEVFGDNVKGRSIAILEASVIVEPGTRVRVKDGKQEEDLGLGTYMGEVDVHIAHTPDGSVLSSDDPENQPPDLAVLPEGSQVSHIQDNPKIQLDTGRVVYGCQVWWEPLTEGA